TLLEEQVRQTEAKLLQARERYDSYRNQHKVAGNLINNMDLVLFRLKNTRQQTDDTSARLSEAEARLRQKEQDFETQPSTLPRGDATASTGQLAMQLKADLFRQDQEIAILRKRYTETNPVLNQKLLDRKTTEDLLNEKMAEEAKLPITNPNIAVNEHEIALLRQQVKGYQAQLADLGKTKVDSEAELNRYKGVDSGLTSLANDIAEKNEERSNLAGRLNGARIAQDIAAREAPLAIMDPVTDEFNPPI